MKSNVKVRVRHGTRADKPAVRDILREFHTKSAFGKFPFSDERYEKVAEKALDGDDRTLLIVSEIDGQISGIGWATAGNFLLSDELILVTVHIVATKIDGLSVFSRIKTFVSIVKTIKKWSIEIGSFGVVFSLTSDFNTKVAMKLLNRMGARSIGGSYIL